MIHQLLRSLNLSINEKSRRIDCPNCGGVNTFVASNTLEGIKYYCFRASCNTKGIYNSSLSVEELQAIFSQRKADEAVFHIPDYWLPAENSPATLAYLRTVNCLEAYNSKRLEIKYDPRQDRHVFLTVHDGKTSGATGRGRHRNIKPKWFVYGRTGHRPFIVPQYGRAGFPIHIRQGTPVVGVLVEDCASAGSVSCVADGIALEGTHLLNEHIPVLQEYDNIIIALDKDASSKALEFHKLLSVFVKCEVKLLDKDLKYYNKKELQDAFNSG